MRYWKAKEPFSVFMSAKATEGAAGKSGLGDLLKSWPGVPPPPPAERTEFTPHQWERFKKRLLELRGIDLEGYRQERIQSRVASWIRRHRLSGIDELIERLGSDPELFNKLQDALFINTSHFFRDDVVFVPLRERILPELVRRFGRLDIWSAGCSWGAEPLTVAMLLWDMGEGSRHHILATDLDTDALEEAKRGVFHSQHLDKLPLDLRRKYFTEQDGMAKIDPKILASIECRQHDLLRDPVPAPGTFHLILCRNVLIYFTAATQRKVVAKLAQAIPVGGYLIIGGTEGIMDPHELGLVREIHAVYRKEKDGVVSTGR